METIIKVLLFPAIFLAIMFFKFWRIEYKNARYWKEKYFKLDKKHQRALSKIMDDIEDLEFLNEN